MLTDYPDRALVDNMAHNVAQNGVQDVVSVLGYVWGRPVEPLLSTSADAAKFDLILLSDLVFNHSEVLARTCCKRGILTRFFFIKASRAALDV